MTPAKHLMISEGFTEIGNNAIFAEIFKNLNDGDEVYFDITNAFRSIPLFGMVLMDYARFLKKDFTIAEVFYGAFEAMTDANGHKFEDIATRNATPPQNKHVNIVHLTEMVQLQEWTMAANDFIEHGNAKRLSKLIKPTNTELAQQLLDLTNAILMCRGTKILSEIAFDQIKQMLISESQKLDIQAQLLPLIGKINEKIAPFQNNSVQNGFAAVDWCRQHGLVQQGYTFLLETVINFLFLKIDNIDNIGVYEKREGVHYILKHIDEKNWNEKSKENALLTREYLNGQDKENVKSLKKQFNKLIGKDGLRNDINHAGYIENPANYQKLIDNLKNLSKDIQSCINSFR